MISMALFVKLICRCNWDGSLDESDHTEQTRKETRLMITCINLIQVGSYLMISTALFAKSITDTTEITIWMQVIMQSKLESKQGWW